MSEQKPVPTPEPLTPEQQELQMFSILATQFKDPLRNIMGQAEEVAQNTVSNLIRQFAKNNIALKNSKQETIHEGLKEKTLNKRGWVAVLVASVAVSFTIIKGFLDII